jgi:hypothetical protein
LMQTPNASQKRINQRNHIGVLKNSLRLFKCRHWPTKPLGVPLKKRLPLVCKSEPTKDQCSVPRARAIPSNPQDERMPPAIRLPPRGVARRSKQTAGWMQKSVVS